jgi:hypothetical protein
MGVFGGTARQFFQPPRVSKFERGESSGLQQKISWRPLTSYWGSDRKSCISNGLNLDPENPTTTSTSDFGQIPMNFHVFLNCGHLQSAPS